MKWRVYYYNFGSKKYHHSELMTRKEALDCLKIFPDAVKAVKEKGWFKRTIWSSPLQIEE